MKRDANATPEQRARKDDREQSNSAREVLRTRGNDREDERKHGTRTKTNSKGSATAEVETIWKKQSEKESIREH
jgi:hypothetical protein